MWNKEIERLEKIMDDPMDQFQEHFVGGQLKAFWKCQSDYEAKKKAFFDTAIEQGYEGVLRYFTEIYGEVKQSED